MANGDGTEGSVDPEADDVPMMMDGIFRPAKDEGTGVTAPIASGSVEADFPEPAVTVPEHGAEVQAEVVEDPVQEPLWKRKWFIGVLAALIGLAISGVLWAASLGDTAEQETPPLITTPEVSEPENPEVTVTETVDATATETERVETTATETAKVQVTATETTKVRSTATETLKINSTATETLKITAGPAPTVIVTVTETVVRQNSEGLKREAAITACADAVEKKLKSDHPDAEVNVPRSEALVAALRNDLDSWFIKLGAKVDDAEQIVDCYVSGNDSAPTVDSILVR